MIFVSMIHIWTPLKYQDSINWVVSVTAPYFIAPAISGKYTETVNLQFRKGTAIAPSAVTGFTESDLTVTNGVNCQW